jgi:hypothetical protein
MKKLIKHRHSIRNIMAVLGLVCCILSAGTSDYHVMELGEPEPESVSWLLIAAGILLLPTIIYLISEYVKDHTKN